MFDVVFDISIPLLSTTTDSSEVSTRRCTFLSDGRTVVDSCRWLVESLFEFLLLLIDNFQFYYINEY